MNAVVLRDVDRSREVERADPRSWELAADEADVLGARFGGRVRVVDDAAGLGGEGGANEVEAGGAALENVLVLRERSWSWELTERGRRTYDMDVACWCKVLLVERGLPRSWEAYEQDNLGCRSDELLDSKYEGGRSGREEADCDEALR